MPKNSNKKNSKKSSTDKYYVVGIPEGLPLYGYGAVDHMNYVMSYQGDK